MTATASNISLDQRVLLTNISWRTYERLLEELGDRPIRLTYDRGKLEIMSPSIHHEIVKSFIGRLIEAYALEFDIQVLGAGSTTFRNEAADQGLEPDECYYIRNEPAMREKTTLDLEIDPPPDLVLEVDVTRSILDRLAIYADLGVPEIWHYREGVVRVLLLGEDGQYRTSSQSLNLPDLPIEEVNRALPGASKPDRNRIIREFLQRVRQAMS